MLIKIIVLEHQALSSHSASIYCTQPVSDKNVTFTMNNTRKWNDILKKITQSFEG